MYQLIRAMYGKIQAIYQPTDGLYHFTAQIYAKIRAKYFLFCPLHTVKVFTWFCQEKRYICPTYS